MLSIHLSPDYEKKIEQIAYTEKTPKDEMIKIVLHKFVDDYFDKPTPYELGKDLFGKAGSGKGNLSCSHKNRLKEKLREKHAH